MVCSTDCLTVGCGLTGPRVDVGVQWGVNGGTRLAFAIHC